jgi:hypothetical protein
MEKAVDRPQSVAPGTAARPPRARLRRFAKGAGAVVLTLIALDLVATAATLALGAGMLRR